MMATYALVTWFGGEEVATCRASFDAFLKAFMSVLFAAMGLSQVQVRARRRPLLSGRGC